MEYLLGSGVTFFMMLFAYLKLSKQPKKFLTKATYTQSHHYTLISFAREAVAILDPEVDELKTQSTTHFDKNHVRVFVFEDAAYWIADNKVYSAKMFNNQVDKESTKEVDTISMDKVELNKMIFIIEKLTEGLDRNERGDSGNKNIQ
jgi:hypothetical protein